MTPGSPSFPLSRLVTLSSSAHLPPYLSLPLSHPPSFPLHMCSREEGLGSSSRVIWAKSLEEFNVIRFADKQLDCHLAAAESMSLIHVGPPSDVRMVWSAGGRDWWV